MKKKILFLIHDLGQGGAEKVLVNLVNNMDREKFDITVMSLFGGGVNEQFLAKHIRYKTVYNKTFPGNSKIMKLFTPQQLHKKYIKEDYDIEISYLEGPAARIISGCQNPETKKVVWIHCTIHSLKELAQSFRNEKEAVSCYETFEKVIFVADTVRKAFEKYCPSIRESDVLYNTNESEAIKSKSKVLVEGIEFADNTFKWCGVGKIVPNKGFDRMLKIQKKLMDDGYNTHFYVIGAGPQEEELIQWCKTNEMMESVTFCGYQTNPYGLLRKCNLYVCASYAEGFSTAATEALIVGTPVCTVEVSGMKEMLGENNEYGVVTENSEEALYQGIKSLLDNPDLLEHYRLKAIERGKTFSTENTVRAVEEMLLSL